MNQKVLTIYGDRGWVPENSEYTHSSIARGYDSLNLHIHSLLKLNPELNLYSVSHSSILRPDRGLVMLTIYATMLYSGNIANSGNILENDELNKLIPNWRQLLIEGKLTAFRVYL